MATGSGKGKTPAKSSTSGITESISKLDIQNQPQVLAAIVTQPGIKIVPEPGANRFKMVVEAGASANPTVNEGVSPKDKKNREQAGVFAIQSNPDFLQLEKEIGEGHFGAVFKGIMLKKNRMPYRNPVAVKTLKQSSFSLTGHEGDLIKAVEDFMKEEKNMKDFEDEHKNVLHPMTFLLKDGMPCMVLPYMENDLKAYISNRHKEFKARKLLDFGIQICSGMEYLAEKNYVHRDLAARNCLVESDKVKIADFSMTQGGYKLNYRQLPSGKYVPVNWMAPESLAEDVYTVKSDVWSFGICLWELMKRGQNPSYNMSIQSKAKTAAVKSATQRPTFVTATVLASRIMLLKKSII